MRFLKYCSVLALLAVFAASAACSWMGETAGRAKAGVENAVDDTKEGYHEGYEKGKNDD